MTPTRTKKYTEDRSPKAGKAAFTLLHTIDLKLDLDMALALGDFIMEARPENPAILALGHQLQNLVPIEQ